MSADAERIKELCENIENATGKDCGDFGSYHGWLEYALTCDDVDRDAVKALKNLLGITDDLKGLQDET